MNDGQIDVGAMAGGVYEMQNVLAIKSLFFFLLPHALLTQLIFFAACTAFAMRQSFIIQTYALCTHTEQCFFFLFLFFFSIR